MIVSTSASTSTAGSAAHALEHAEALQLVEHAAGLVVVERRHPEGHVAEHLDEDAAEARP